MENGKFIISLDFEIYWGVRDVVNLSDYKYQLEGVREAIPLLLEMFKKYNINATFATVGFLFFCTKKELLGNIPERTPGYLNSRLSPYAEEFKSVGENENIDPFHLAGSLVEQIKLSGQEIGSHSFSHYYCLEKGQSTADFREDIIAAKKVAAKIGIDLKSFVFPRNQYNENHINICKEMGFTSFRGNENSSLFSSKTHGFITTLRRPFRLLDSYLNLSGYNCYSPGDMANYKIINIPSSRFLRPYSKTGKTFEKLKLKRITDSMDYASKNRLAYHLWWHPHNFGYNMKENFSFLEKILIHYKKLNEEYNFESVNMQQLAKEINNG